MRAVRRPQTTAEDCPSDRNEMTVCVCSYGGSFRAFRWRGAKNVQHRKLRRSRCRSHRGHTLFNQIALNFPVFERREQQLVRRVRPHRLIVTPLTLRHFFQFASGFSPSPSSPSPLCCSRYHCSFLCFVRPLFGSPFGSGRDKNLSAPNILTAVGLRSFAS